MKTLSYPGFTNKPCSCQYAIGALNGKPAVVFVQGPLSQTSITNQIEAIVSKLLAADLRGTRPDDVRFFEYYSPQLQPLRVWQEVTFEKQTQLKSRASLFTKLLEAIREEKDPGAFWRVDSPQWQPVHESDRVQLEKLVQ